MPVRPPSPVEQAVVGRALSRGWLRREQLREALLLQGQLEASGRPTPLLGLLRARYLRAEHVEALKGDHQRAARIAGHGPRALAADPEPELPPPATDLPPDCLMRSGEELRRPPEQDPEAVRWFIAACEASTLEASPPSSGRAPPAVGSPASGRPPRRPASPSDRPRAALGGDEVADVVAPPQRSTRGASPVPADEVAAARVHGAQAFCAARRLDPHFAPHADHVLERLETLGEGGMGVVYRVRDLRLGREAALKLVKSIRAEEDVVLRFRREVEITARLDHPSIPPVYEAGTNAQGLHYMLMRVVEGEPLSRRIKVLHEQPGRAASREGRSQRELLEALVKVGEAVAHAHERGVIHRDLKPQNVIVGQLGLVCVVDWGLARDLSQGAEDEDLLRRSLESWRPRASDGPELTQAGEILGTPGYMPPEQAEGRPVDARADVFALGAVLCCVLTGRPPVEGTTPLNKIYATTAGKIELPRDRRRDVPAELNSIAARALAKAAADRYQSAEGFVTDLRAYLAGEDVTVHRYGPWERLKRSARRHVTLLVGMSLGTLALAGFGLAYVALERAVRAEADAQAEAALHDQARSRAEEQRRRADRIRDVDLAHQLARQAREELWPTSASEAALEPLRRWLERTHEVCGRLPRHREALAAFRARAESAAESEQGRTLAKEQVDRLELLVPLLQALADTGADPDRASLGGVQARIARAERRRRESVAAESASWRAARASISDARGSPTYAGLELEPVDGLVPLGRDGSTGLWEFWHVPSGERPVQDGSGRWTVTERSGLVMVLLPPGSFSMGSARSTRADERPVRTVEVGAFFLSKYEVTQAQWQRWTGENPSEHTPTAPDGEPQRVTLLHPVEMVSWEDAARVLPRLALALPSEAQWEYACRAGTTTEWWTGDDKTSLVGAANLADARLRSVSPSWGEVEAWDDGYPYHAPVGSLEANDFGLHDMAGNVWEWVQDTYQASYEGAPIDASAWVVAGASERVLRGGCWGKRASMSRSAGRKSGSPALRSYFLGLRPAVTVER